VGKIWFSFNDNQSNPSFKARYQHLFSRHLCIKRVCDTLHEELLKLESQFSYFKSDGPYDMKEALPLLVEFLQCNIVVVNPQNPCRFEWRSACILPERPTIFLEMTEDGKHVALVKKLSAFYRKFGFICLYCEKYVSNHLFRERRRLCKKRSSCFSCHPYLQSSSLHEKNKLLEPFYCDPNVAPGYPVTCENCNVRISSESCRSTHRKICSKGKKKTMVKRTLK
jgi:hypothetical protein